ncbi:MAG: bifunctional DNA primase/polymerase [Desulfitobacterium hafniense]
MKYTLEKALSWIDQGIAVIPVKYCQKIAAVDWKRYQGQLPTRNQVMQWFEHGFYNLAIITGWQGLTVLDWDSFETWQQWQARTGIETYSVITARGVHSYFFTQQPAPTFHKQGMLDIQGPGRYVLGVPSVHPSRWIYQDLYRDKQIQRVQSIHEVIPELATWLQDQPEPMAAGRSMTIELQPQALPENPLDLIDAPTVPNLTAAIKERFSILSFFQDAQLVYNPVPFS